ncbi:MAG: hypothetical protein R3325_16370 [Thermoanaerobaculia bacterium]|nr:hypothetical protein [Thermoanaerobaculia bacterium]
MGRRRGRRRLVAVLLWTLGALGAGTADAGDGGYRGEWSTSGSLEVELRWFPDSPADAAQLDGVQPSVAVAPQVRWRSPSGRHRLEIGLFGRWDGRDDARTHADLRVAAYRYLGDGWELLAGLGKVFWGVAESRHLVDVVNQTDAVEEVDEEEKLGQPMVRLALDRRWGRLELFALPGFRERSFAGVAGRPRPPLPVDPGREIFASRAGDRRLDAAVRWSHFHGSWDLGAHLFRGTGREPAFALAPGGDRLLPVYRVILQAGVDVQYTRGAWLGKLEALVREGQGRTFPAAVAGLERTLYRVGGSTADLGLLFELLYDGRDAAAPPTVFDDDLFLGVRLAANDAADSELLTGAVVDRQDGSVFGVVEGSRRLASRWTLELEGRLFEPRGPGSDLAAVDRDSHLRLELAWRW